jgi:hypothetical protein
MGTPIAETLGRSAGVYAAEDACSDARAREPASGSLGAGLALEAAPSCVEGMRQNLHGGIGAVSQASAERGAARGNPNFGRYQR